MTNHPNRKIYWIDNALAVDPRTIKDHGDNGERADQCVVLYSAQIVWPDNQKGQRAFYLGTNGDPCLIHEDNQIECALSLRWSVSALRAACGEWLEYTTEPDEDQQRDTCTALACGEADQEADYLSRLGFDA